MTEPDPTPGHYYLVGFMGCGKTTVGKQLAELLDRGFVDLDHEIETDSKMSIRRIFELHGESTFRQLEEKSLRAVAGRAAAVVATGGGTIVSSANREVMGRTGLSVWLNESLDSMIDRIHAGGSENRPMSGEEEDLRRLFRDRLPAYRSADIRVDIGSEEVPAQVAARILLALKEIDCDT